MAGSDDGRLKIGYGTLNDLDQQNFGRILDTRNTSAFDIIRQVTSDSFKKSSLVNAGPFKGIALRVDINPTNNPVNSWLQRINPLSKPRLAVKVRIPELHACLLEPTNYGPNCDASNHIIDMYPSFVATSDDISNEVPAPGDIVWVDFGNKMNMTDPQYLGIAYRYANGGAVGRETGRDMFSNGGQAPLGVLPPLGDNPITGLATEENQIPQLLPLEPTRTGETTVGSFSEQIAHIDNNGGMPKMETPAIAYREGSSIGNIDLIPIPTPIATREGLFIAKNQEKIFYDLINAAKHDGISLQLNSGFRSNAQQSYLYEGYKKGLSGFKKAARPRFSNHQDGTAFDFNTGSPQSDTYRWLATNAHKFGFYNAGRFFKPAKDGPKAKNDKPEHWHWRYLGINDPMVIAEGKVPLTEKLRSFA